MKDIVINPEIRLGKPTIKGTRVTVEEVVGALESGMDFSDIEKEYGVTQEQTQAALSYLSGWLKGEEVSSHEVSA
jgi:uncharacterized protein (DUF433 family)